MLAGQNPFDRPAAPDMAAQLLHAAGAGMAPSFTSGTPILAVFDITRNRPRSPSRSHASAKPLIAAMIGKAIVSNLSYKAAICAR